MAKQKYVKVQVALGVGNRKSNVVDPVEVEEDTNWFDGELNALIMNFLDAVKALPCSGTGGYSHANFVDAVCECFDLQRREDLAE